MDRLQQLIREVLHEKKEKSEQNTHRAAQHHHNVIIQVKAKHGVKQND